MSTVLIELGFIYRIFCSFLLHLLFISIRFLRFFFVFFFQIAFRSSCIALCHNFGSKMIAVCVYSVSLCKVQGLRCGCAKLAKHVNAVYFLVKSLFKVVHLYESTAKSAHKSLSLCLRVSIESRVPLPLWPLLHNICK